MKHPLFLLAMAGIVGSCHATQPVTVSPHQFYGSWKVTKINAYGEVTQSEHDMQALLGSIVVLSATQMVLAGEPPCKVTHPKVIVVDAAEDASPPSAPSPQAAGLPPKVAKLDDGCLNPYKVGAAIVFPARGAWYTAERVNR